MSDAAQVLKTEKIVFLRMHIRARVDSHRFVDRRYFTVVTTPASDEFSRPQQFEIRSENKLGEVGEVLTGLVSVSGYVTRKPYTDKKTGESKVFTENNVFFDWL